MRTAHPFHMHDAIYAQPGALRLVPRGNGEALAGAAERLRAMDHVLLSGVGTSWHAALVGELLLAHVGKLGYRARAIHAFDLTVAWPPAPGRVGLVVVSHRGSARSAREALERGPMDGVSVVVTGKHSDGLGGADFVLRTVELEASHAHTVSYTSTLALLALLAAEVGRDDVQEGDRELAALAAETIEIASVPELLSPILAVVPLQLLCYHLALESGANPDTMRAHEAAHARALEGFTP